jgi:hypothetical protein
MSTAAWHKSRLGPESDLNDPADNTVKLVAYTIVSLMRGQERIMERGEGSVLVTANLERDALESWILAEYLQKEIEAGHNGQKQPRATQVPAEELKYLRVHYVIAARWPRESLEWQEKHVAALRCIQDAIS